jgi:hypothetical protein
MSNQCDNCDALECKVALIDDEGIVVNVIIANHHDDLEALHKIYVFEKTMEVCSIPWCSTGDKWDEETQTFIDKYYSPGLDWTEDGKYKVIKTNIWSGHPDWVEPEPTPEPTALELAEEKLAKLGLTKEDLQALLA